MKDSNKKSYELFSILCFVLYIVTGIINSSITAEALICLIVIVLLCYESIHLIFSYAVKNDDFSIISKQDNTTNYNKAELKNMVIGMDNGLGLCTSIATAVITVASLIFSDNNRIISTVTAVTMIVYIVIYIFVIMYYSFKSNDRIYIDKKEKVKSKQSFMSALIFVIYIIAVVGETIGIFAYKEIQNNTESAVQSAGYIIGICIVMTIGLCIDQFDINKKNGKIKKYRPGTGYVICMIISLIFMVSMGVDLLAK